MLLDSDVSLPTYQFPEESWGFKDTVIFVFGVLTQTLVRCLDVLSGALVTQIAFVLLVDYSFIVLGSFIVLNVNFFTG